jgi:chromosome segregation ATPase
MRKESEHFKSLNDELQAQLQSHQSQESNVQGLNAQISSLNNELEQQRWALGEGALTMESLAQQIQGYEGQNADLRSQIKRLEDSLTESSQQNQQLIGNCEDNQVL